MTLLTCGLNHKTAPIAVREQVAITPHEHATYLDMAIEQPAIHEVAIVSTCNRTEMYCETDDARHVLTWLAERYPTDLRRHIYVRRRENAIRHMMRVACGLDSMALGETQILGQIKTAYHLACEKGTIGKQLGALFQSVFAVSKRVRTQTMIGVNSISIACTAVDLVKRIFADLSSVSALLIGAGETTELTARYLQQQGVNHFIIANRTLDNISFLINQFNGKGILIGEIPQYLPSVDIVVSATASSLPILGKGMLERVVKQRKHRPLVLIDLAVPRDIEPEANQLSDVFLYNIDDLQTVVANNLNERQDAARQAETIIEAEIIKYSHWQRSLRTIDTLRQYRKQLTTLGDAELQRALQALQNGKQPEDIMQELTHRLLQKVMHQPSVRLRKAGSDNRDDLLKVIRYLFTSP